MATTNGQPLTDDEVVQALTHLAEHPAWSLLEALARHRMEEEFLRTSHELMAGNWPDRETIAWRRGFFAGMKFLIDKPARLAYELAQELEQERNK